MKPSIKSKKNIHKINDVKKLEENYYCKNKYYES